MANHFGVVILSVYLAVSLCPSEGLVFSAFNIKWLTPGKYDKPIVSSTLPKIIRQYDITLIQELRGDGINVMSRLIADLNSLTGHQYGYVMSKKTGRTSYKEQYAFVYRQDAGFSVETAIQFNDTVNDVFEREPYMVLIHAPDLSVEKFAIVGAHVKPADTVNELDALAMLYGSIQEELGTKDVLFTGDFNADCSYLSGAKYDKLTFTTDSRFNWLIAKKEDTTVSTSTTCAYDRFVTSGSIKDAVVPGSVSIYDFKTKMSLSDTDAKIVTDHYPIQLTLE